MFLTIDNTGSGFNPEFKNLKQYDFFFLSSSLSDDFLTLSVEVSFKLFNDCLHCSLKRNKPVFILKDSVCFRKEWIELVEGKDSLIHEDFIFIDVSIKDKVRELLPKDSGQVSLSTLSNNYSQL
jgi:hypothetical protein